MSSDVKEMQKDFIEISAKRILGELEILRAYAKRNELLNSQEWINFEDALNKISVEDPQQ